MAKKRAPTKNKLHNKTKTKTKNHTSKSKIKSRNNKMTKTPLDESDNSSSDDADVPVAPSSSTDSPRNDVVVESSDADADEPNDTSSTDEEEIEAEPKGRDRGKKRSKKEDDDDDESDAAEENNNDGEAMYRFPMNRISRIIRSDNPDVKISQEAVFLINRASEKFLQVFCREAYACLFLEDKTHTSYNHLSSVVAKRKRFGFLSDFVPEKVKAEDALAETSESEN